MTRALGVLLALVIGALPAAPAGAVVARDGTGFGLADDAYHGFPGGDGFKAAADHWYGRWFEPLRPRAFRFQIHWNADPLEQIKAVQLIDWVRAHGVTEVVVSFKKSGPTPSADAYATSIRSIVRALASRVDAWGAANEPNIGDTWLPGLAGAELLAAYWQRFAFIVEAEDPTALKISPEFADRVDLQPLSPAYMNRYLEAGGGFGDVAGWHVFWGAHHRTLATTEDYLRYVPAGVPVWVTEAGGFGRNLNRAVDDPEDVQNSKVLWLTDTLARQPGIERLFYYHARDSGQPDWDSGLLRKDGSRRPAWYSWCVAAHAGNFTDRDCTPVWFAPGWAPQL